MYIYFTCIDLVGSWKMFNITQITKLQKVIICANFKYLEIKVFFSTVQMYFHLFLKASNETVHTKLIVSTFKTKILPETSR